VCVYVYIVRVQSIGCILTLGMTGQIDVAHSVYFGRRTARRVLRIILHDDDAQQNCIHDSNIAYCIHTIYIRTNVFSSLTIYSLYLPGVLVDCSAVPACQTTTTTTKNSHQQRVFSERGLCSTVDGTYGVWWDIADCSFSAVSWWAALGILCVIGMLRIVAPQFLHESPHRLSIVQYTGSINRQQSYNKINFINCKCWQSADETTALSPTTF